MTQSDDPFEGVLFHVKGTVEEAGGDGCSVDHEVGQSWYLRGVPPGICSYGFQAMFPAYWTLRFGGSDPAEADPDQMKVTCARGGCGARFRLERISEGEAEELTRRQELITIDDLLDEVPHGLSRKTN